MHHDAVCLSKALGWNRGWNDSKTQSKLTEHTTRLAVMQVEYLCAQEENPNVFPFCLISCKQVGSFIMQIRFSAPAAAAHRDGCF